ncbi:MAG TPA: ATP-dependent helicase, partial [Clostridium sp.]|nr:ATP-dependent helicase [Clostridium sp.]
CTVLEEDNPFMAIIFCRTKRRADDLEIALHRRGFKCEKLHGDLIQSKRERIMKSFRNADIQYLIATDVAARGLDVSGVTHIYNYDIPESVEGYIHRIGRTGRA